MHDIALMAANEWAKAQAFNHHDPAEFGQRVAQVYHAARATTSNVGEQSTMAPIDRGPNFIELLRAGVISQELFRLTPTPEQRANALELSAILSRYVSRGSVIDGANLLADKLASSKGYERAAELIFRADLISSDVPLESWGDLIKLADAVAVWLKTGEMSAGFSVLQQAPISPLDAGVTLADLVRHGLIRLPADAPSSVPRTDPGRSTEAWQAPPDGEPGSPAAPGVEQ